MYKRRLAIFVSTLFFFTACKKNDKPTSLRITVKNHNNIVAGAKVTLHTANPYTPIGDPQITGSDGTVFFTGLTAVTYYINAEKGCMMNLVSYLGQSIQPDADNHRTVKIDSTGILKIVNSSTNNYTVAGQGTTLNIFLSPGGTSIYPLKTQSYIISATSSATPGVSRDTLINIHCGDTTRISYL